MWIVQALAMFISIEFMFVVLFLVYKRRLREEYSLLWLFSGVLLVIFSLFPRLLIFLSHLLQIDYPPSLLFIVAIIFMMIIVLSQAVSITTLIRRDRDLAQKTAILEYRLERLREDYARLTEHRDQIEKITAMDAGMMKS